MFRLIKKLIAYIRIPSGDYCYHIKNITDDGIIKTKTCPYWKRIQDSDQHSHGYCLYLKHGDLDENSFGHLWDKCKECGIKEN